MVPDKILPFSMKRMLREFRFRALTTCVVLLGFVLLLVSGGVLFVSPPGRVANWSQWQMLGLTKRSWSEVHIAFSALFLTAAMVHLAFNWRPLLHHFRSRVGATRVLRLEWGTALLLVVGLLGATRAQLFPVAPLVAWGERMRASWEVNSPSAPVAHAELLTLTELAERAGVPVTQALARLQAQGVEAAPDATVQRVAEGVHWAPSRVYEVIGGTTPVATVGSTASTVGRGGGPGRGMGTRTLAEFCREEGLEWSLVQERLSRAGIRATPEQTLRDLAAENGYERPYALLEMLRGR